MSDSLQPHGLYTPWNSPGQNYWNGYPFPSPGGLPTQGSNPGLPHRRQIIYQLSHKGSPRIMEWVAYPFSSGSSQLRNRTGVSCIAGRFFTSWATREAHGCIRAVLLSFHYTAIVLYFLFPDGHQDFLDHFFFFSPLSLIYYFSSEFTKLKCLHYHHILILSPFSVFQRAGAFLVVWLRANKDNAFLSAKSVLGGVLSLEVISWL